MWSFKTDPSQGFLEPLPTLFGYPLLQRVCSEALRAVGLCVLGPQMLLLCWALVLGCPISDQRCPLRRWPLSKLPLPLRSVAPALSCVGTAPCIYSCWISSLLLKLLASFAEGLSLFRVCFCCKPSARYCFDWKLIFLTSPPSLKRQYNLMAEYMDLGVRLPGSDSWSWDLLVLWFGGQLTTLSFSLFMVRWW